MFGGKTADWISKGLTAHHSPTKKMDRPLIRVPILPQHKAIEAIIGTKYTKGEILANLALAQFYGVRPPIMHDNMRANNVANAVTRNYIDCIGNIRIYITYPSFLVEPKKIYIYWCAVGIDYIEIETIQKSEDSKLIDLPCLPEIKKGNYNLAEKFSEILKKLKT